MFDNLAANKNNTGVNDQNFPKPPAPAASTPSPLAAAINNENKKSDRAVVNKAVEDIFAETDSLGASQFSPKEKPSIFKPKTSAVPLAENNDIPGGGKQGRQIGKYIFLLIMVFGFILLLVGAYIGYQLVFKAEPVETEPITSPAAENTPAAPLAEEAKTPAIDNAPSEEPAANTETPASADIPLDDANRDTDHDGLTDTEETALGTNINNSDSDSDGLYDREEARVYKTDPLNPDTDGDTFLDGGEVKNGFNPKGAGKLYDIN